MSFKHIPKFVWIPIASLLWAFFALVLLLIMMSYRVKSLEIDLLNLAIKVQYVDQQLAIAQQSISSTMNVIDGLSKQVSQYQSSQQPVINQKQTFDASEPILIPSKSPSAKVPSSNEFNQPILQQLQMQKIQLEGVSGELKHIQNNLQSSIQKKNIRE